MSDLTGRSAGGSLDLEGVSVAGVETCLTIKPFRLALDMGRCTRAAVNMPVVAVSHGHLDHCGALAQHAARRALLGMPPARYLVPQVLRDGVEALFNAHAALDGGALPREVVPVRPGDRLPLGRGRELTVFETPHRVPSVGYAVWSRHTRLKAALAGMAPEELAGRRRAGAQIHDEVRVPELAFTSDTRPEVVEREEVVRTARVLIMECTFLDDAVSVQHARDLGHVHLEEWLPRAPLLRNEEVWLTHFSARYQAHDVERILTSRRPADLRPALRWLAPAGT